VAKEDKKASGLRSSKHLLNLTLAGLPELDHFPSLEERQKALWEIGNEAGDTKSGWFWLAILAVVGGAILARYVAGWLLSYVALPGELEDILKVLTILAVFFLVLRWLHRRGAAAELRRKLLARGVPVCMGCGYLLRGLSVSTERCPECGRAFDGQVEKILTAAETPDAAPPH